MNIKLNNNMSVDITLLPKKSKTDNSVYQRRNLSKNQRVRLAYALKDSIAALAHKNLSLAAKNGSVELAIDTLLEIAKVAGVGRTTIAKFQFVMEKASAETKHKMVEGDISINNAFEETKSDSPLRALPMSVSRSALPLPL